MISFDLSLTATWPKVRWLAVAQALTRCKADFPAPRSCDRRTALPSMAICFTPRVAARACIQPRKHDWKAAGLIRANTRRKVSFDGMPPGSSRKVCNQSAFFRP